MSSIWGERLKISIFGESHGAAIGVTVDGLPAGERIDFEEVAFQMARRAPGLNKTSTGRVESDKPEILSGISENSTNGAPVCAIIRNNDAHSGDYTDTSHIPRPGHADYTAGVRYSGHNDYRGGGHFSGRLTAPLTFAGSLCRQILFRRGIGIGAHLIAAANVPDKAFDQVQLSADYLNGLSKNPFPVLDGQIGEKMREAIENARLDGDSVGGIVECAAAGLPAGLGDPIFGCVESRLSSIVFGIPAVAAIAIGSALSALLAPASLVLASTVAFALSETADLAVFTPLQRRGLVVAATGSSFVGLVVDSFVFLSLAFGSLEFLPGQIVGKTWMVVLAVPVMRWLRKRDARLGLAAV